MKHSKAAIAALISLPILLGATACKETDQAKEKASTAISSGASKASEKVKEATQGASQNGSPSSSPSVASQGSSAPTESNGATPAGVLQDPMKRGGNYYAALGKAHFDATCNIPSGGYNYKGVINGAGQVGAACAKVTEKHKRVDPIDDPAGFSKNAKVSIPSVNGKKPYNGYFYNRSHMISAALGGSPKAENLITGTRMQNVGERNKGGMRYTETQAEKYVASPKAKTCALTYEVTPHYRNTTDAVPTWVEVNMQSCDKSIDERVAVFNDAAGHTIDYATGEWKKN